jgi:redox-sensitive bicupin YhaK (pirin superfamily)
MAVEISGYYGDLQRTDRQENIRTYCTKIMMELRKSEDRGIANFGWLTSRHTFSFGHYYDPRHTGFGPLLVINDDQVQAGRGFDTHGHRDMEIISYVLEGELAHKDSMGNLSVLRPGDVQRMSAGTGVMHSEFNHSPTQPVHFLQIWIEPASKGIAPGYEEKHFDDASKRDQLRLIASPDGSDGSVRIHQDTRVYASLMDGEAQATHRLDPSRRAYVHVVRGAVSVNGIPLVGGDAAKFEHETTITLADGNAAEVLLFDLP